MAGFDLQESTATDLVCLQIVKLQYSFEGKEQAHRYCCIIYPVSHPVF